MMLPTEFPASVAKTVKLPGNLAKLWLAAMAPRRPMLWHLLKFKEPFNPEAFVRKKERIRAGISATSVTWPSPQLRLIPKQLLKDVASQEVA